VPPPSAGTPPAEAGRDIPGIDPQTGAVLERLQMPAAISVSGLEADGGELFHCGGGRNGRVHAVKRPRRR